MASQSLRLHNPAELALIDQRDKRGAYEAVFLADGEKRVGLLAQKRSGSDKPSFRVMGGLGLPKGYQAEFDVARIEDAADSKAPRFRLHAQNPRGHEWAEKTYASARVNWNEQVSPFHVRRALTTLDTTVAAHDEIDIGGKYKVHDRVKVTGGLTGDLSDMGAANPRIGFETYVDDPFSDRTEVSVDVRSKAVTLVQRVVLDQKHVFTLASTGKDADSALDSLTLGVRSRLNHKYASEVEARVNPKGKNAEVMYTMKRGNGDVLRAAVPVNFDNLDASAVSLRALHSVSDSVDVIAEATVGQKGLNTGMAELRYSF